MTHILSRKAALGFGLVAVGCVVLLQAFNSFDCYQQSFSTFLVSLGFIAIPMLPALAGLATRNPLRSVVASAFFAPWLMVAYYTDCVLSYQGGGASMVYVLVVMFGLPSALVGFLIAGPLFRRFGVAVSE
jgi:hypothetical protein